MKIADGGHIDEGRTVTPRLLTSAASHMERLAKIVDSRWLWVALMGVVALVGVAFVFIMTPYGVAMPGGDTINYYGTARNLTLGNGYVQFGGDYFVRWPPLYPTVQAIPMMLGLPALESVRLVNVTAYALTLFVTGLVFLRVMQSRVLALLGAVALLFSWSLLLVTYLSFSEVWFSAFVALYCLFLVSYLDDQRGWMLITLGVIGALACLTRYLGVSVVAGGGLAILLLGRDASIWRRLRHAVVMGVIAAVPLALWFGRNYALTGSIAGGDWENLEHIMHEAVDIFVRWAWDAGISVTEDPLLGTVLAVGGIAVLSLVVTLITAWQRHGRVTLAALRQTPVAPVAIVLTVFVAVFTLFAETMFVHVNQRILAPVLVPFMLVLFALPDALAGALNKRLPYRLGTVIVTVLVLLWLQRPVDRVRGELELLSHYDGPMIYNTLAWQNSDVIAWVREQQPDGARSYSNNRNSVAVLTDVYPFNAPRELSDWSAESLNPDEPIYFIWFHDVKAMGCNNVPACFNVEYDRQTLETLFEVETLVEYDEGGVYQLRARPTLAQSEREP